MISCERIRPSVLWTITLLTTLRATLSDDQPWQYGPALYEEGINERRVEEEVEEDNPLSRPFYIGGVLPNEKARTFFQKTIDHLNFDGVSVSSTCTLYPVSVISSGSPIRDARLVCNKLIGEGIFAMVIGGDNITTAATSAISYTGGFYHIPVIGTAARESSFSDKNIHVSFLRTVPAYSQEADVWVELLKNFKFRRAVFIHASDSDGRALLGKLRTLAETTQDDKAIKLASVIEFEAGIKETTRLLRPLTESLVRVFLLFAKKADAEVILAEAAKLNLTGKGSVWVLTEDALNARNTPIGALGLRLKQAHDHNAHIADSLKLVTLALRKLHDSSPDLIIKPPNTCEREEPWNITGKLLFRAIQEQILFRGETGKVAFDSRGDRMYAEYSVVNVQNSELSVQDRELTIGQYFYSEISDRMELEVNTSRVLWGGGDRLQPSGISVPRLLKVLTMEETPFLYSEVLSENEGNCSERDESICRWMDPKTFETRDFCCFGYCVELLNKLSERNDFSFTLHLASDAHFGENYVGDNGQTIWTGMIGELVNKSNGADMIVAPLTINPERAQVIDFSKPFKYQGITILVKKAKRSTALVSILQPFQFNLWMMLLATVHAIALLVWLLDRLSPMFKCEGTESDSLKISEAFWFSWGVILNSGLGEGTPRCLSSRVMSMIWAGFAMIIVASYTANLAAFLVLEDHGETITGINDAKMRNPVEDFVFATVRGSAVDMFFRRKTEWANMYRVMETNNFESAEEAIKAVKNGTLKAFIWDSSRLEYEASQDCDLVTVGELFGRSGYGIGIRKGLFWSDKITLDILELHESGFMADLDDKWIWEGGPECPPDRSFSPQRLGLANLEGIFVMVVGGVVAGSLLIVVELVYKKRLDELEAAAKGGREGLAGAGRGEERLSRGESREPPPGPDKCEFCDEKNTEENDSLCPFCSEISAEKLNPESQAFVDQLESRIESSQHIPSKLKAMTPRQWIQFQIDHRSKLAKTCSGTDDICLHSLSDHALRRLLNFVDQNEGDAIPGCECDGDLCPQESGVEEPCCHGAVQESPSEDVESIISGEFSCPRLQEVSGRAFETTLPDVVFS